LDPWLRGFKVYAGKDILAKKGKTVAGGCNPAEEK
jgi:hypothetical protein